MGVSFKKHKNIPFCIIYIFKRPFVKLKNTFWQCILCFFTVVNKIEAFFFARAIKTDTFVSENSKNIFLTIKKQNSKWPFTDLKR